MSGRPVMVMACLPALLVLAAAAGAAAAGSGPGRSQPVASAVFHSVLYERHAVSVADTPAMAAALAAGFTLDVTAAPYTPAQVRPIILDLCFVSFPWWVCLYMLRDLQLGRRGGLE